MTTTIEVRAQAMDPIHHGAGTAGNTALLRVQEVLLPDGEMARVPFISGNSIKHRLRESMVHHAVSVLKIPDHSVTTEAVNLLYSGGALTSTGSSVDLALHREFQDLWPALGLCGYAAGNHMTGSKLSVSHWHLVCSENFWRLPVDLAGHNLAKMGAATMRSSDFGTRMSTGSRAGVRQLVSDTEEPEKTGQMIYDFETIAAGALLYGTIRVTEATAIEWAALQAGIQTLAAKEPDIWQIAAKTSVGFGRCKVGLKGMPDGNIKKYEKHLSDNRDAALKILERMQ